MNTQKIFDYGTRNLLCAISVMLALTFTALSLTGCPTEDNGDDKTKTKTYTVTFDSDGGSAVSAQTVTKGGKAARPEDPTKSLTLTAGLYNGTSSYTFTGWQKDGAAYDFDAPVTADITLTAAWTAPATPGVIDLATRNEANIIAKAVAHISADNSGATVYTLVLGENVTDVAAITHIKNGVTLTITSVDTTERVISKGTTNGTVFTVGGNNDGAPSSAKLVIDGTVTLQGKDSNDNVVVFVRYGGSLELKGNAKITGNTNTGTSLGGGVYAQGDANNRATVTMSGNAEISNNTNTGVMPWGGGVCLSGADLTMSGNAAIKNNTISGTSSLINGGGVYISGTFTMNGGEISGNSATTTSSETGSARGGGVYISGYGSFIVASEAVKANIKNNTATNTGGGTAEGPQVYKGSSESLFGETTIGVFTVGGVAADTF